jgi:predicted nucleic acid-binding protein
MDQHSASLYLSTVTVAEIEDGIAKAKREKATRKAADLAAWLETLLHLYGDRILAFDLAAARIAGVLSDLARGRGAKPGFANIMIAATARSHGLTILTRMGVILSRSVYRRSIHSTACHQAADGPIPGFDGAAA